MQRRHLTVWQRAAFAVEWMLRPELTVGWFLTLVLSGAFALYVGQRRHHLRRMTASYEVPSVGELLGAGPDGGAEDEEGTVRLGWLRRWNIRRMSPAGARRYAALLTMVGIVHALLQIPVGNRRPRWYNILLPIASTILADAGAIWLFRWTDRMRREHPEEVEAVQRRMEDGYLAAIAREVQQGKVEPGVFERAQQRIAQRRQQRAGSQDDAGAPGTQ